MRRSLAQRVRLINGGILMPAMSKFDHSDLDGRLLQVLLAVIEERSVTRAAERLDVTQSAVSHLLDKLRAIVGDPLFYEPLGVAFDKGSALDGASLLEAVDEIVAEMHEDGTLTELSKKWYNGIDLTVQQ